MRRGRWQVRIIQLDILYMYKVAECTVLEPWRYLPWPFDSILEAVLTVSPNRQYRGIVSPTTPAAQGPVCSPIRSCSLVPGRCLILNATVSSSRSRAIFAISAAWRSWFRIGTPDTHMYASPIVSTYRHVVTTVPFFCAFFL